MALKERLFKTLPLAILIKYTRIYIFKKRENIMLISQHAFKGEGDRFLITRPEAKWKRKIRLFPSREPVNIVSLGSDRPQHDMNV